jgi:hypothetical protein
MNDFNNMSLPDLEKLKIGYLNKIYNLNSTLNEIYLAIKLKRNNITTEATQNN